MQAAEIVHVADADFQEIVEVPGHQMAVDDERHFQRRTFERRKTLRGRAVQHHTDNGQRAQPDGFRRNGSPGAGDIAVIEQALGTAVAGRRAGIDLFRQVRVGNPCIRLQDAENPEVSAVELR